MDEQTPDTPETDGAAPGYTWGEAPAEPAAEPEERSWQAAPAAATEGSWAAPAEPEPESAERPAWAPAIWQLDAAPEAAEPPAAPVVPEIAVPAAAPPAAPPVAEVRVEQPEPVAAPPVVEPEPVAEAAPESTSLLKKEISFRRKPKAEKPAKEKTEKAAGGSFLKKEISFGRKPKAEKPVEAKSEKAAGGSFLKKDISFRRKPKAAAPVEAMAEATAEAKPEQEASTSFLKQDLSFRRKPKAERAKAARAKKRAKAAKGPREPLRARLSRQPKEGETGATTHKKLVGLKIGASQLAAARVLNNGSSQLVQLARQSLDPGIVVGGEVRDPDALATALRDFFAANKLPKRGVRLGLANNRIGVRIFELDGIEDARQLTNAIRFRAQEALPIPIDEAVLDYHVLGERVDEEGRTLRRVLLVVAYRELIDRYVTACRKAGIQLVGIDLEAFALLRALSGQQQEQNGAPAAALVAVAIGHDRSTFAVSDGRHCEFTRVLEWGGSTLDVAVARALDLAPSEAEPIKRALGLEGGEAPDRLTEAQVTAAREAIGRETQTFARELVSSLQFYQNQPGSLGIAEIVITGGTAHLAGLGEQLEKLIGVRVRVGDPLEHVRTGKKLSGTEQIGSLTVAIGLGVER